MTDALLHRVRVEAEKSAARTLADALEELFWPPPQAVGLFESGPASWQVDAYFQDAPDADSLRAFIAAQGVNTEGVCVETVPDEDWVALVQSSLAPVSAGRFVIHGSHDRGKVPRGRRAIEIDAAQAFGTAHHGSTRGCLIALDALARRHDFARILDLGTGTGVLAIAAARLWNARIVASDIDPVATRIAAANAARNAVTHITTVTARGLGHPAIRAGAPYDLITANILARPLVGLARQIARASQPGGMIVLSGLMKDQAGRVAASYGSAGFTRERLITIEEWVTLILRRR